MPIFDIWVSMFYPPVCTISLKKKMFVMIKNILDKGRTQIEFI